MPRGYVISPRPHSKETRIQTHISPILMPMCFPVYATENLCDVFLPGILLIAVLPICDTTLVIKERKICFPKVFFLSLRLCNITLSNLNWGLRMGVRFQ